MRTARTERNRWMVAAVAAMAAWIMAGTAYARGMHADRVIDLNGTTNTRDIGGYPTADEREVRAGQIIRSENLSRLTADDFRRQRQKAALRADQWKHGLDDREGERDQQRDLSDLRNHSDLPPG